MATAAREVEELEISHPLDLDYQQRRRGVIKNLMKLSTSDLDAKLRYDMSKPYKAASAGTNTEVYSDLMRLPFIPSSVKGILDSTSSTSGSVLIRQDLEPTLYSLFVRSFPAFEKLAKGPSNGLVHAFNQITSPDATNALGGTIVTELGVVGYTSSTYVRQTAPIAVFATGRGISFKELAAVAQGGAPYDPHRTELANGMVKLATDIQYGDAA